MPNVNLIAARREEKKRLERVTRQLFFGFSTSVGALVLLGSFLGAQRFALNADLRAADAQMDKLKPTLDRIAEVEKQTATLKPKVDTLQTAKTSTMRWRALFTVVSQSIPANAWLSSITASGSGADTTLSLVGAAGSQTLVGETMTRLNSHAIFDKIDLHYTQAQGGENNTAIQRVNFEIGAHLVPPPAPPVKKDDAAAPDASKTAQNTPGKGDHHDA